MPEYDEVIEMERDDLIEEYGTTNGLAIYLAANAVKELEKGTYGDLVNFMYYELVDFIDE